MRQHQTRWWSACIVIIASLGVSGVVASGCGDDDDNPTGVGGTGGTGGADGGAGKGGSAGKGGTGSGTDAAADISTAQCRMTVDSGAACTDTCFCTTCPTPAAQCFGNMGCVAIVECIRRTGCMDTNACVMACGPEVTAGMTNGGLNLVLAFQSCLMTCAGTCLDAGMPPSDAPADNSRPPDAPADNAQPPMDAPVDNPQPPTDSPADNAQPPMDSPADNAQPPMDSPADNTSPPDVQVDVPVDGPPGPPDGAGPPDGPPGPPDGAGPPDGMGPPDGAGPPG